MNKTVVNAPAIPYIVPAQRSVYAEPPYADELRLALAELERGESKVFGSVKELFADLNAKYDDEI